MAHIYTFEGMTPRVHETAFLAPTAVLIGNVTIGAHASIWYGAVLRGDSAANGIVIGARTSIQDNCVLHVTHDRWPTVVAEEVTIGHGAIVHGCTVKRGALIGMGARVLDGAVVGECALVAGVPAKVKRDLTDAEIERLEMSWRHYIQTKEKYLAQ